MVGLGVVLPALALGFSGRHGQVLSAYQFAMHSLAVAVFGVILGITQNHALRRLMPRRHLLHGVGAFALLPAPFWFGFGMFYVPFDILFLFTAIGVIQAAQLRRFVRAPLRWAWQSVLTSIASATAGIAGAVVLYFALTKSMTGIEADYLRWLAIGAPAAIVSAGLSRFFLGTQLAPPQEATWYSGRRRSASDLP